MLENFLKTIEFNKTNILVIGDSMLDEFFKVKVTRISPESPNNCVSLSEEFNPYTITPGGASNICYQLKYFNANLDLITFADKKSTKIFNKKSILGKSNINLDLIELPKNCFIPRKKRFFDNDVQVSNRWDIEKKLYGLNKQQLETFQKNIEEKSNYNLSKYNPKIIILSDYNKGIFEEGFSFIKKSNNYKIIVDPKDHPISKWKDKCDIFKPNSVEAYKLSDGIKDWKDQCDYFQNKINCESVIITLQGDGVVGKYKDEYFDFKVKNVIIPAKISGAGDFFIGILGLAIANNYSLQESARIAFHYGTFYVKEKSTNPIDPYKILKTKFIDINYFKNKNYKLVFTNGCYDILHAGHIESFKFAKSKGDKLVVAVNSDESIKRLKGENRPFNTLKDRLSVLNSIEYIDYIIPFEEDSPYDLIKKIKPNVLVKGEDWKDKGITGADLVKEIYFCPLIKDLSTTNLANKIKNFS